MSHSPTGRLTRLGGPNLWNIATDNRINDCLHPDAGGAKSRREALRDAILHMRDQAIAEKIRTCSTNKQAKLWKQNLNRAASMAIRDTALTFNPASGMANKNIMEAIARRSKFLTGDPHAIQNVITLIYR
jgi:hypothetical protein